MSPFRFFKFRFQDWDLERKSRKQRKKRGFADKDCWGLDYWFCETFPKMLRNLRDMKHGAAELEYEEVDTFPIDWITEESKILLEQKKKKGENEEIDLFGENKIFDRWWFILSRIAYLLEQASPDLELENEYADEYFNQVFEDPKEDENLSFEEYWRKHTEPSGYDEKGKPISWVVLMNKPDKDLEEKYEKKEKENAEYKKNCLNEALTMFEKYFYAMWD